MKEKVKPPISRHASLNFHPAPLQHAEQRVIGCAHSIDPDDLHPERRAILRSRATRRRLPKTNIIYGDPAEEHEDAGDDVGRRRDEHLGCLFVRCLRDET